MAARFAIILGIFQLLVLAACTGTEAHDDVPEAEIVFNADTTRAQQLLERVAKYRDDGRCDSAMASFDRAHALYRAESVWSFALPGYAAVGRCAIEIGQFEEARQILGEALAVGIDYLGESNPALGDVFSELGWLHTKEGNFDSALDDHKKALELRIAAFGDRHGSVADTYNRLALVHYFAGDYQRAEALYIEAQKIRDELNEPDYLAAIHNNLGLLYRDQGQYDRAVKSLEKSLELARPAVGENHPEVASTLKNLGETHRLRGDYDKAFEAHQEALRIAHMTYGEVHPSVAHILNDLAIVYSNTGNPQTAIPYYKRSLSIIETLYGDQHYYVTTRLSGLGVAHLATGDYDLALQYLTKALRIRRAKFGQSDRSVGVYLNNIGEVFSRRRDYERARDHFEKALNSFIGSLGEQHPYVANEYKKLGGIMNKLGEHEKALAYLDKALSIFRATSGEDDPYVATVYSTLGVVYDSLGSMSRALAYHRKALRHIAAIYGKNHPAVAARYNEIGDTYRRHGAYEPALTNYRHALAANQPTTLGQVSPQERPFRSVLSESDLVVSLWGKARVLSARAAARGNHLHDLEAAHDTYLYAAQTLDRIHRRYRSQNDRLHWVEVAAPLMSDAVDVSVTLYNATGEERYKSAAFYFAEKSKGSVLLGALSEARARRFAGIPDSLLRQERSLLASLVSTEQRLLNMRTGDDEFSSTDVERLEQEAFTFTQQHSELIESIETSYPNYYKLKYNVEVATPERVQAEGIDRETALVEYTIGDKEIFIFTLSSTEFDITAVPRSPRLEWQVEELRRGIIEQKYETYTENARALYVQLLEPVMERLQTRNLLIVPDGVLNYVPFESLLTEPPTSSSAADYSRLPYLINRYAVSYAYSSTLLTETRNRARLEPDRDFVAYAPVASAGLPTGSAGADLLKKYAPAGVAHPAEWGYLPMTGVEVTQIKRLFARNYSIFDRLFSDKVRVYLDKNARESQLMSDEVSRYRYVHFATHGFADAASPESSGIVLFSTPSTQASDELTSLDGAEPDWSEDGVLRLDEVYALRLNADVVVLSACDTGMGPVARGEGILSLARGFLYAGASNVVASLWKADDLQTQRLMLGFYEQMLDGSATSASLRSAKLDLIRESSRYARPYYWATFVLIGV